MSRAFALALVLGGIAACRDSGNSGAPDAAPDLSLPAGVTHIGGDRPACCIVTTSSAWRVLYLADPAPGGSDSRGRDVATKGELHIADAYGADVTLAEEVPRGAYTFNGSGDRILFLAPTGDKEGTYALKSAALSADTLGTIEPITVVPRGLLDRPLAEQSFFSATGRYLIVGVTPQTIAYSSDLTVVEVDTARVVLTLPNGSFDYIEAVTSSDVMIYQNSKASRQLGVPSQVGLYVLPLASAAGGGQPSLIDTRTVGFTTTGDEHRILYTRFDGSLWLYDLTDHSRVQLASDVVTFTVGGDANGPLVWIGKDLGVHVTRILQPTLRTTAAGSASVWTSFTFSPSGQDLYFFDRASSQDNNGDLLRLDLRPGATAPPRPIERRVGQSDFTFIGGRMRFLRALDGRGEMGELVTSLLDGSDLRSIARGVPVGSLRVANPRPAEPPPMRGNPPRGAIDMSAPIVAPVYAHLLEAARYTARKAPLFDDSDPIVGKLAFAREDQAPVVIDPAVHVGGYRFSGDGYVLVYIGETKLDDNLAAYTGSLRVFQTLVDQSPVPPMLSGVSELGRIRERAFFVAAPAASPQGIYFVRY